MRPAVYGGEYAQPGAEFGYLTAEGLPIYCARHPAAGTAHGTVLLCGTFGLEIAYAALVWTRWARRAAQAGWDAIRFDWRGTGESGGEFREVTVAAWEDDLRRVHGFARQRRRGPVVLMGLRAGCLVAANAFAAGLGDALVLWEPPASGRAYVMEVLRRKIAADYVIGTGRKTRDEYLADLASGGALEVEGFTWSSGFCQSLLTMESAIPPTQRPSLSIGRQTHPMPGLPFWQDGYAKQSAVAPWFEATVGFLAGLGSNSTDEHSEPTMAPSKLSIAPVSGLETNLAEQASFASQPRVVLTWRHDGLDLVATHHAPSRPSRLALVLTSFARVPRHGHGGLATRICQQVAAAGVHAFRVDQAALGDAMGDLPDVSNAWSAAVREGALLAPTLGTLSDLAERFGIEKFFLGGHCAGALTAIYAPLVEPKIAGIVLLEPEFFSDDARPADGTADGQSPAAAAGTPVAGAVSRARQAGKALAKRVLGNQSPIWRFSPVSPNTIREARVVRRLTMNEKLAAAWRAVVEKQLPALVVMAQGRPHEVFFLRAHQAALDAACKSSQVGDSVRHIGIPATNHAFSTGEAVERIALAVTDWLCQQWPK